MTFNIQTAIALVEKHAQYCEFASHYGEPGYTDPKLGILFANWNNVPQFISDALERRGFELEWSDEWIIQHETDKAYRTSPDCYSWTPYYHLTNGGEVIGGDEIEADPDDYIEEILNDCHKVNVFDIDFEAHGFTEVQEDDFETGWHPGQNDDPAKVFAHLKQSNPDHDFLFDITEQSQFYMKWKVWRRPHATA